jgi:hypothetical protein
MKQTAYMRTALAIAALDQFPPIIRQSLISDRNFSKDYDLITDAKISFGNGQVTFDRSSFFEAVRTILESPHLKETVADHDGSEWSVTATTSSGTPVVSMKQNGRSFSVSSLYALAPNAGVRTGSFEKWADEIDLPSEAIEKWRVILNKRPLDDSEMLDLTKDGNYTLLGRQQLIQSEIEDGTGDIETLVPRNAIYYERLIGAFDGSNDVEEYAKNLGKRHFSKATTKPADYNLNVALLLSSHSSLVKAIPSAGMNKGDWEKLFAFVETEGDYWSKLGALEKGLEVLDDEPEIADALVRIAKEVLGFDVKESPARFKLLSALFSFVAGELSRSKILSERPPFWRRIAALSQAAVIERQIIATGARIEPFIEWSLQVRGQYFYLQSLCDLRTEPRWLPDFVSDQQLLAEFAGRIANAARINRGKIKDTRLTEVLLGDHSQSANSQATFPRAYYPGPLEGGVHSKAELPEELKDDINKRLNEKDITFSSFISLVNSIAVFQVDTGYADLAAKALSDANFRLKSGDREPDWGSLISGLAHVAAVTRNTKLAESVWYLGRRWRQISRNDLNSGLSLELLRVGLICAAANTSLDAWCKSVGGYVTELAFQEEDKESAVQLLSHLKVLLDLVPQLWITCGKADAALRSLLSR